MPASVLKTLPMSPFSSLGRLSFINQFSSTVGFGPFLLPCYERGYSVSVPLLLGFIQHDAFQKHPHSKFHSHLGNSHSRREIPIMQIRAASPKFIWPITPFSDKNDVVIFTVLKTYLVQPNDNPNCI